MTKKQQILNKAAKLFLNNGYAASSMRDLASEVGIEPSSLYSHYTSKQEILAKLCFQYAEFFIKGIEKISRQNMDESEQIRSVIHLHIDIALKDKCSFIVFSEEWRHLSGEWLEEFLRLRKSYESDLEKILEKGIISEKIKKLNVQITLQTILSATRWVHYASKLKIRLPAAEIKKNIEAIILQGIHT